MRRRRRQRRPRRQDAPTLAGRATERALARRRLPRPDPHARRAPCPRARPRAARRCVALRPRPPRQQQRARGDDAVALRPGPDGARQARRRSTWTTVRPTAERSSGSSALVSASRCCTPSRTTRRRAGKMERFWRRMREEALSHIGQVASLADVEQKLRTWLTRFYQDAPHAGILGRAPATVFAEGEKVRVTERAAPEGAHRTYPSSRPPRLHA